MHYTQNCPRLLCKYCLENGHTAKNCIHKYMCQICGQPGHPTSACKSENATEIRVTKNKVCILCNCKGHIAKDCGKKGSGKIMQNNNNGNTNKRYGYKTKWNGNKNFKRWKRNNIK